MSSVLNAHHCGKELPGAVYIGRPSRWGNPFRIGPDGDRDAVMAAYINWLHDNPAFVEAVRRELHGKDLICWCAPSKCHGDILRALAAGEPLPERVVVSRSRADSGLLRRYVAAEVAGFCKTRNPYGEFSNMHSGFPLSAGKVSAPSTEALYQALRYPQLPDFQQEILDQPNPMAAKRHAHTRISVTRDDWAGARITAMRFCIRLKAALHFECMQGVFHASQGREIVEVSARDDFWGAKPHGEVLIGQNVLGRLLMELRDIALDWQPGTEVDFDLGTRYPFALAGREIEPFRLQIPEPAQPSFF